MFVLMVKEKKKKVGLQMLIHNIDEGVYKAVIKLAFEEKRSVGKQAEYMLKKFIELEKEKK